MNLLHSKCERAWLFNVSERDGFIYAGLACFSPGLNREMEVQMGNRRICLEVPAKASKSQVPVKIANARLSVLSECTNE